LRLTLKASQRVRVFGYIIRQEFEGNEAMQFYIFGFVHHTHTATAQLRDDAVVRNGFPDHCRECYVSKSGKSMKAMELASA
jgi:hypothetical protein